MKVEITVRVIGDRFPYETMAERNMEIRGEYPAAVDVRGAVNGMILAVAMESRVKLDAVAQAEAQVASDDE